MRMMGYLIFAGTMVTACAGSPRRANDAPIPVRDRRPIEPLLALPALGEPLPQFSYLSANGTTRISNGALAPLPAVVLLWSTHCPFGMDVITEIARVQREYAPKGVRFVVLAAESAAMLRAFEDSAHTGLTFALTDERDLRERFDRSAVAPERATHRVEWILPTYMVMDARGRVAFKNIGPDMIPLRQALDAQLANR